MRPSRGARAYDEFDVQQFAKHDELHQESIDMEIHLDHEARELSCLCSHRYEQYSWAFKHTPFYCSVMPSPLRSSVVEDSFCEEC